MPVKRRVSKVNQYRVTPAAVARWREVGPAAIGVVCIHDDVLAEALGMLPLIAMPPDAIERLVAALNETPGGTDRAERRLAEGKHSDA